MSTHPKRLGKYELQMRLGQGGMAEVWKAFDPQLQRTVAIKFLHANLRSGPDFMNRFVREGQAIASLHHPNIVQVYDFQVSSPEDENPMAYMVMDYIEGPTLAEYLHRTSYAGVIPAADEIVRLFTSLGLAVDYAHQHHMIHRDIKPANILLDTRNTIHNTMGEPILTDFGIVKMLGAAAITSTGISMGTPLYISPEQIHGQAGNEKSDIYALGVILYEMCTGGPPYRGDNPYVIMAQRIAGLPDPPSQRNPDIPPAVDAVILRCLAMDPQERFTSALLLAAALADAFNIPLPNLVHHILSALPPLPIKSPTDLLAQSTPPSGEIPKPISSIALQIQEAKNSTSSSTEGATILSNYPDFLSTPENGTQSNPLPSDTADRSTDVPATSKLTASLPPSMTLSVVSVPHPITTASTCRRKRWFTPVRIILLVVLISTGIAGTYAFLDQQHAPTLLASSIGSAIFLNSGQSDNQNIPFINDKMQMHLSHVSAPVPGQLYYAWGQDSTGTPAPILLGALQDHQGEATLSYIDNQHRNLLTYVSSFLITEQPASAMPTHPSSHDRTQWRYTAALPQMPSPLDHMSYLDHLRHLLVFEPTLERSLLHRGIDFWLLNNTQELYADVIKMQSNNVHQILTSLLYHLDGPCAHQELGSTSDRKMSKDVTIAPIPSISLLDCAQGTHPLGYISAATHNLNGMVNAPNVSKQEMQRAAHLHNDLTVIQGWLEQIRMDALQLVHLENMPLKQAQMLRNDLLAAARNMLNGHFDPLTQTLQPSMQQICDEITFLAHFDFFRPDKQGRDVIWTSD